MRQTVIDISRLCKFMCWAAKVGTIKTFCQVFHVFAISIIENIDLFLVLRVLHRLTADDGSIEHLDRFIIDSYKHIDCRIGFYDWRNTGRAFSDLKKEEDEGQKSIDFSRVNSDAYPSC